MKMIKLVIVAIALAGAPACKKKSSPSAATGSAEPTGSGSAITGSGSADPAGSGSAAATTGSGSAETPDPVAKGDQPAAGADFVSVYASHKDKKPTDPVEVKLQHKVTKAKFDPKKIEGGTATIELDPVSLETDSPKRSAHLTSDDYLKVKKFTKIVIDIANVKNKAGQTYTADANVTALGTKKKYPVTFEVVEAKDDWVKIKGEHTFPRQDFKIGKAANDKDETVAPDLTIKLQVTLKNT